MRRDRTGQEYPFIGPYTILAYARLPSFILHTTIVQGT